jgi:transcriptional regulator with XRE-family HTH domain
LQRDEQDDRLERASVGETLRQARRHRGWSLREVERRTGRPNAYLSQIERGVIRNPDPHVLWELAELYRLNFGLLAEWSGLVAPDVIAGEPVPDPGSLVKLVMKLSPEQRKTALKVLTELLTEDRSTRT